MIDLDTSDLEHALANDPDGRFQASATDYLNQWRKKIAQARAAGLPQEDFEGLGRLDDGICAALRIVETFASLHAPRPAPRNLPATALR